MQRFEIRNSERAWVSPARCWLAFGVWLAVASTGFSQSEDPFFTNYGNRSETVRNSATGMAGPATSSAAQPVSRQQAPAPLATAVGQRDAARPITRRAGSSDSAGKDDSRPRPQFWTTFGSLLLVVAVILVLGRLWKKHGGPVSGLLPDDVMQVLGKRPLDPRHTIHLVRIGHRILVLGSTAGELRTLAEFSDAAEVDTLAGLCQPVNGGGGVMGNFRTLFSARTQDANEGDVAVAHPVEDLAGSRTPRIMAAKV